MTLLGWIFTLTLIGSVALIVMKLVPIYLESFKVDKALSGIIEEPGIGNKPPVEIYKDFVRRMDIDEVDRFSARTVREYVTVEKNLRNVTITVEYQAETHLIGNVSLIVDFKKQVSNS